MDYEAAIDELEMAIAALQDDNEKLSQNVEELTDSLQEAEQDYNEKLHDYEQLEIKYIEVLNELDSISEEIARILRINRM